MRRIAATLAFILLLALPSWAQTAAWQIDPAHSSAQFAVRHLGISTVRGEFSKVTGVVRLDPNDVTKSSVEATIDATTIDSREPKRDAHLRSADFLDTANYPTLTFRSKRVERAGPDRLRVTGDLTIRGVTREVVLDVEGPAAAVRDPWGNTRSGIVANTRINRKDFGLVWNAVLETGGLVVADEVAITIDVELVKQQAPAEVAGGEK